MIYQTDNFSEYRQGSDEVTFTCNIPDYPSPFHNRQEKIIEVLLNSNVERKFAEITPLVRRSGEEDYPATVGHFFKRFGTVV